MVTTSNHIIAFVRFIVYITLDTVYIRATMDVYGNSWKNTEHVYVQIGSILHFYLKYSLNKKSFLYMSAIKQNEFSRKNIFLLQLAVIS